MCLHGAMCVIKHAISFYSYDALEIFAGYVILCMVKCFGEYSSGRARFARRITPWIKYTFSAENLVDFRLTNGAEGFVRRLHGWKHNILDLTYRLCKPFGGTRIFKIFFCTKNSAYRDKTWKWSFQNRITFLLRLIFKIVATSWTIFFSVLRHCD